MKPILNIREVIGGLLVIGSMFSLSANAITTIEVDGTPYSPIPSSMEQAIQDDFYFIFDSFYDDTIGSRVNLVRNFIIDIPVRCRVQLGGYVWVTPPDTKGQTIWIAVTHGDSTKPVNFGDANDSTCHDISLEFNNGFTAVGFPAISAGAWVTSIPQSSLPTGDDGTSVGGTFQNVQVHAPGLPASYCSTISGGSGGPIDASYSNNGVGNPSSFTFNDFIGGPGFGACSVDGELYSVHKANIFNANHTPGIAPNLIPNPSPVSKGEITIYQ